jgi:hypothetical protein
LVNEALGGVVNSFIWVVGWLAAAPIPWNELPVVKPPLGSLNEVVTLVPDSGLPNEERVEIVQLPGCPQPQAFWLTRFALGAAMAGEKLDAWVRHNNLTAQVFTRPNVLTTAVDGIRKSAPRSHGACPPTRDGWLLDAWKVSSLPKTCAEKSTSEDAGIQAPVSAPVWFGIPKGRLTAVVTYGPPSADAQSPCRPRMSAVLFDDRGVARLRYHTDFDDMVTADLVGDGCIELRFTLDEHGRGFRPMKYDRGPGCPPSSIYKAPPRAR